jgi:DNA-binding CsgD family transcriptional regulator
VSSEDRLRLERSQSLPAVIARRAQMNLCMADGESNASIARRYRTGRPTVTFWRT